MQEKLKQSKPILAVPKQRNPFVLKFTTSTQQRPRRIQSLNRLNYPQNLQKDGTITAKKDIIEHQLFDHHVVKTNIKIQSELKRLQVAFIHEKVPQFYVYYFMNRLTVASQEKIQDKIIKQLEQIKTKRSFSHVINNSIKARQGCLKQLQRCIDNLFQNQDDNVTKHVFRQEITHYRKLTGFVISHIRSWKLALNDISPQIDYTMYLYHGQDYLLKLLNDCEFIFNSFLTKHLKFSYRNDPFIMRPYMEGKQSKYLELFKFDDQQKNNYVIDLNYLASQRAKYLQTKMNSKNQKIKQIQRIYHYRDIPLTSRILIRKIATPHDKKDQKQQKNDFLVNNFVNTSRISSQKKLKLDQLQKKSQKLKIIKQTFGKTSEFGTKALINADMFQTIGGSDQKSKFISPYQQKLRYTQFHNKKLRFQNLNYESDFQNILRKKQLDVLRGDNANEGAKTQRSFKNIKIKDNLSQSRRFITKQQGFNELQMILSQLDTFSPQRLQNFRLKKKQDPKNQSLIKFNEGKMAKSRLLDQPKSLLEYNSQVYANIRNQVIQQIEKQVEGKAHLQQKRQLQNKKIQEILQKKINQQSLKIINDTKKKQLQGRQHLSKQLQSQQIFGYDQPKLKNYQKLSAIQEELRKQMQLKWLRQVHDQLKRKTQLNQMQKIKKQQQKQLNKKLQKVKQKDQMQKRFLQIQRQQRNKALKKQLQLDQERKRQIQQQMRVIIERQRQNMQRFAASQKVQLQGELREAMKAQLLQNLRKQNEKYYDDTKKQQQVKKKQREYRQQARKKIQQQYNLAQEMKQNRQRQQKMAKIRLVKQKLGQFDVMSKKGSQKQKSIKNLNEPPSKNKLLQKEMLKSQIKQFPDLRESVFPKYQKSSQVQKKKLREQFQLQLFAFRKPETYDQTKVQEIKTVYQQGKFPIKDFKTMIDQQMKQKQQQQIKQKAKQQQQKLIKKELGINEQKQQLQVDEIRITRNYQSGNGQKQKSAKQQTQSDRFTKFSHNTKQQKQKDEQDQLIRMKLGMTYEQYQVYKKKKRAITAKRDIQGQNQRKKAVQQKKALVKFIDEFQKMDDLSKSNKNRLSQFDDEIPDNLSLKRIQKQKTLISLKEIQQIKEEDLEQFDQNIKIDKHQKKQIHQQEQQEQQGQKHIIYKKSSNKFKKNNDFDVMPINSRVTSYAQKHFATSDQQQHQQRETKKEKRKLSKKKKQVQDENNRQQDQKDKISMKSVKRSQKSFKQKITTVKIRQIPVVSLTQFFTDHFQHLPKVIKKINIYKKQELIRFLLQHSSFSIFQFIKQNVSIGIGVVLYNQNKSKYRSLNIVHLGSYDETDYLEVLLNIVRYCFKNDPCQQITMSNIYDKQITDQWQFIKNFQKKFDPYGAIFQKKIFNTQFQRKFVLRRNIGQVCKVELIPEFNRGMFKLSINSFITESNNENEANRIIQADDYQQIGYNVGFYGILANHISERFSQDTLAFLIAKSTSKDSTMKEKIIGSLGKLALSMKKIQSYQRLSEITQQKFDNIMNLNLELIAKNEAVVPYPAQSIEHPLNITWQNYRAQIQLSYDFYSQTIPIKIQQDKNDQPQEYLCKYLRFSPNKKNKMFTIKSNAYSTKVTVFPCKNNKYKIFIMDPQQYEGILSKSATDDDRLDLGVYIRVFFANIIGHQVADYDQVWMPETIIKLHKNQMTNLPQFTKTQNKIQEKQAKGKEQFTAGILRSQLNFTYTDYLGNSLKLQPSHRDLVVTPPFIFGILNMQIQKALQGSPVFIQRIRKSDMCWIKEIPKIVKQSD